MNEQFLITGTDTEIGKTVVSAGLLRRAAQQGRRCVGLKPVAAGCRADSHGLRNDDALALMRAANVALDYQCVNPIALEPPISPHIALARSGQQHLDMQAIHDSLEQARAQADWILVEGFGGWLAPLDTRKTFADLAMALQLPVILVVGLRLGCLNHALLSARAILADGCELAGWVGNCIDPDMLALEDNIQRLRECVPAPCLGIVSHGDTTAEAVAAQLSLPIRPG